MSREAIVAALRRSDLFRCAGGEVIEALAAAAVPRAWGDGEVLFTRGDPSDGFYIVLQGTLRLTVSTGEGRELILREVPAGGIAGEIGALDGGPRSADARVSGSLATAFVGRARLDRLMAEHPAFAATVLRVLCGRLRDTTDQLEGIALYPLRMRLARFLLLRARRDGVVREGRHLLSLPLSQSALAEMLGATRPKVNGVLTELERTGVIERHGALLAYVPERLAREAQGREAEGRADVGP